MEFNIKKILPNNMYFQKLEFFEEFNIYKTIPIKECYIYVFNKYKRNLTKKKLLISSVEATNPILNIKHVKIIDTIVEESCEEKDLSDKKLLVIGEITSSLIINYYKYYKCSIKNIKVQFTILLKIPNEICDLDVVNLRYFIEDVSVIYLGENSIIFSITSLIKYDDQYIQ